MNLNLERINDIKAIDDSIIHWQQDYKKIGLFGGVGTSWIIFDGTRCPCCRRFKVYRPRDGGSKCAKCPLDGCDINRDCQWRKAMDACKKGDKKGFMRARYNIIRRLRRAKARLI